MQSNQNLLEIIKLLRNDLEKVNYGDVTDLCEEATTFAFFVLKKLGYKSLFVLGDFLLHPNGQRHCWLKVEENIIIDLTIDQFGDYKWGIISNDFYQKHFIEEEVYTVEEDLLDENDLNEDSIYYHLYHNFEFQNNFNHGEI